MDKMGQNFHKIEAVRLEGGLKKLEKQSGLEVATNPRFFKGQQQGGGAGGKKKKNWVKFVLSHI